MRQPGSGIASTSVEVEVVRSARRRKTVSLQPTADGVRISIPAWATQAEEQEYIDTLLKKWDRRRKRTDVDLEARAVRLARELDLARPLTIEWAGNQQSRWGSCSPSTGAIRISTNVQGFPSWVIDYVIVHELVHLLVPSHGPEFWAVAERYPRCERARGFLIAKGLEQEPTAGESSVDDDDVVIDADGRPQLDPPSLF